MNPLFRETLNRAELLAQPAPHVAREKLIAVHRNHSFELVADALNVYLGLSAARANFLYSDYDDSLSFQDAPEADLHLLWLDAARYAPEIFPGWLAGRVERLRALRGGVILAACLGLPGTMSGDTGGGAGGDMSGGSGGGMPLGQPDSVFFSLDALLQPLGERAFDLRLEPFSGTRLSNQACLHVARELGARVLPSLLFTPLKAVIVDLDHTLHEGVLGEDGPEGVRPFIALQQYLKELRGQGFMLALASRNEEEDVRELFASRGDYPLQWEDFAAHAVNWEPKAENIRQIVEKLHIAPDAVLFVDDNPGEILHVSAALPDMHVLRATSGEATLAALRWYPGLYKSALHREDSLRSADIRADAERATLRKTLDPRQYLRELNIELCLEVNAQVHLGRMTELLNKTNQFILAFRRPSQSVVQAYLDGADSCVISARMRDSLSDSGLIAVLLAHRQGGCLVVDELTVSCRALGRGVEGAMLEHMLAFAAEHLGTTASISVEYVKGPRNAPALNWLEARGSAAFDAERGRAMLPPQPLPEVPDITIMRSVAP